MKDSTHKDYLPLNDHSAFQRRLKSRQRVIESFEVKANKDRTVSEKAADFITSRLGTMTFLILNSAWFLVWIIFNLELFPGITAFDPYPFGLLTMIVSLEAIFLATIVLISQNRAAKIDDLREEVELQINTIAEEEITKMIELQILLLKKNGIDVSGDKELQLMLEPVDTQNLEASLRKQF
jgi:uncharacterized membrane protein